MSFFGKNIRKIRNVKNMSQQAFADIFDLKRATLGAYEEERSEPKIDTLLTIANYFGITTDDLLTKELTVNQLLKFKGDFSFNVEEKFKEKFAKIPCITEKNYNEYAENYTNDEFISNMPTLQLPISLQTKYRAYTIMNLEMTNHDHGLFPKDVAVGELVTPNTYKNIENGNIVLALTNDGLILRRLYCTEDAFIFRADHKSIEDMSFSPNDIKELWEVKYIFYRRIPEPAPSQDINDKLSFLEQEFLKLKNRM